MLNVFTAMHNHLLSIILMISLVGSCFTFTIEPIEFELLYDKFRLSISNDRNIQWVTFHVNINKEFKSFKNGELNATTNLANNQKWSVEFQRKLQNYDIVYIWLAVEHNGFIYRNLQDPISVEAFKSGNANYRINTANSQTIRVKRADDSTETKVCIPSVSEVSSSFGGGPYCRGDLIFSDDFNIINTQYWTDEIFIPPPSGDAEFVFYNGSEVKDGVLHIQAVNDLRSVTKDIIDLGLRCTSLNIESECSRIPHGTLYSPAIKSGRLTTKNHFSFKYGRIDVKAKMPVGDWLFALIALQPTTPIYGTKSGEMRVALVRGNVDLISEKKQIGGKRLYGGVIIHPDAESRYQFMHDILFRNVLHLGDEFNEYSLIWTHKQIVMMFNNEYYGHVDLNFTETFNIPVWEKGGRSAPFDQMFHITLSLAAGGHGDFPDTQNKPWNNTDPRSNYHFHKNPNLWSKTWLQPSLDVDYVRIYAT